MTSRLKQEAIGAHVRRLRSQSGMTLRTLARQSGFSASFMSQVENGEVSPSIRSMEKIATTLGVGLGGFFAAAAGAKGGLVVRAAHRGTLRSGWSRAEIESLSAAGAPLEAILITLRPGGRSGKHPYPDPRAEFAIVLKGRVVLTLGPEEHRLGKGDAASILPGELRLWRNDDGGPARVMVVAVAGLARQPRTARRGLRARA
jgi:transcriptional regulator with XRE-family HTH domain